MKSNSRKGSIQSFFQGASGRKNAILAISLIVVAILGIGVLLSSSSTSIVSPFLLARTNGILHENKPSITASPSSAAIGSKVTLTGTGFRVAQVYVGKERMREASSFRSDTKIVFEVPNTKRLTPGTYQMYVRNFKGKSNVVSLTILPAPSSTASPSATPRPAR